MLTGNCSVYGAAQGLESPSTRKQASKIGSALPCAPFHATSWKLKPQPKPGHPKPAAPIPRKGVKSKEYPILDACKSQPTRLEKVVVMVAQSVQLTMLPRPVPFFI